MEQVGDMSTEWGLPNTVIHDILLGSPGKDCARFSCINNTWRDAAQHDEIVEKVIMVYIMASLDVLMYGFENGAIFGLR